MTKLIGQSVNLFFDKHLLTEEEVSDFDYLDSLLRNYEEMYGVEFEEETATLQMLKKKGINNEVFFNPLPFDQKSRESSGEHKANILNDLRLFKGIKIGIHFEDDPIQAAVIRENAPHVQIVLLQHDLVEKENVWHEPEV